MTIRGQFVLNINAHKLPMNFHKYFCSPTDDQVHRGNCELSIVNCQLTMRIAHPHTDNL